METEKLIKKSDLPVIVKCDKCLRNFPIRENIHERDMEPPYDKLVEGYFVCPHCEYRRHVYFLTPRTAQIRMNLNIAVHNFKRRQTRANYHLVGIARKAHQQAYDDDQQMYQFLLKEEDVRS